MRKLGESHVVIFNSVIHIDDSQDFLFLDDIQYLDAQRKSGEFIHEKIIQRHIYFKNDLIKIDNS